MSKSTLPPIQGSLVPVELDLLHLSPEVPFNLYIRHGDGGQVKLFRHHDYPLTPSDIERLEERGVVALYISPAASRGFSDYLREQVVADESLSRKVRYQVLWKAARIVLPEAITRGDIDQIVLDTNWMSTQLVQTICHDNVRLSDLFSLTARDGSLFSHMMNVSTYAGLLAWEYGIQDPRDLSRIGHGAMLHDIGKLEPTPSNPIMSKHPTQKKAAIEKQHPTLGFRALSGRKDLDWGTLMMVYQHHEKCDGQGYPVNLPGPEIHDWARLCAVANTFEALTHEQPDRQAESFEYECKSLELLAVRRELDEEMVRCLTRTLRNPT